MTEVKNAFSINDYIIDFENIYRIISQKDQIDFSGKTLSYFIYQPISEDNQKTTYSTPIDNISKSGLRHLIDQKEVKSLYKIAEEKIPHDLVLDFKTVKETLYENDPTKNIFILKQLFLEREKEAIKFSRTNKEFLESILKHLSLEVSFVTKKPIESVTKKISSLIEKAIK